jgi:hypothetical protein
MPDSSHNDELGDGMEVQIDQPSVRIRGRGIERREVERC